MLFQSRISRIGLFYNFYLHILHSGGKSEINKKHRSYHEHDRHNTLK
jgi:hypothetical protein